MKYIKINNVPNGANVLIANDNGTGILTKEDEIRLYKYDGDGQIEFVYGDAENIVIRVRCANDIYGYWKPVEILTKDIPPDGIHIIEMEKDKHLK